MLMNNLGAALAELGVETDRDERSDMESWLRDSQGLSTRAGYAGQTSSAESKPRRQ